MSEAVCCEGCGHWFERILGMMKEAVHRRACRTDNVRILAHFRIPALMEKDMGRAGYDFQSLDN
ncbi:hypothetical protein, partial [Pseudoscardovia suis]|uniref:hypothetical protein n=1 Tax=Pseudoscardovia suis TaxID=987063 RepID=UPI001B80D934